MAKQDLTAEDGTVMGTMQIIKNGRDPQMPEIGDNLEIKIHIVLEDGQIIDSTRGRGNKEVIVIELGSDKLCVGGDAALRKMTKGMVASLVILPEYAYPDKYPNEAAYIDIELVRFNKPTSMCTQCLIC